MKTNYSNLDLLRSLAVLSVVASHLYQQCGHFQFGVYNASIDLFLHNLSITGVMFFFVHTCLVLMLSMHRAPEEHRGRSFLIRRAFRIYPLCWATILLVLTAGLSDQSANKLQALGWRGIAANLLLMHDLFPRFHSIIGPLWSLPLEVQMYLVLPLFFVLLRRFDRLSFVLALWLGATLLGVATARSTVPRVFHAVIFPPMFIAGMVAYQMLKTSRRQLPAWGWPFVVIGLFLVSDRLVGEHSYDSPQGTGVYACICLAVSLAIPRFRDLCAGWIVRPAQQIAKYSYGIYLLHIPALMFVIHYLPGVPLAPKVAVFLCLTALLSFVSFHKIVDPLIKLGKRLTRATAQPKAPDFVSLREPVSTNRPIPANPFSVSLAATDGASTESPSHALNFDCHSGS
jgi:peptidoglycan/LPS O-acetylase OafA/YrhL